MLPSEPWIWKIVLVSTTSTRKSTFSVQSTFVIAAVCLHGFTRFSLPRRFWTPHIWDSLTVRSTRVQSSPLRCCYPLPSLEVTRNVRSLVCETSAHKPKNFPEWSFISFQELVERIWGVIKTFLFGDYFMKSRYLSSWLMWNNNVGFWGKGGGGEGGTGLPGDKPLGERGEPTTRSAYVWCRRQDLNPGQFGHWRRVLSPLPKVKKIYVDHS